MKKIFLVFWIILLVFTVGCSSVSKQGKKLLDKNEYSAAIRLFQDHLAEKPGDTKVREQLGYAYLKGNYPRKAITEFDRVLKEEPDSELSIVYLGMAYLRLNDLSGAIGTWKKINDTKKKVIKREINRLLTLIEMAEARRLAIEAVASEKKLNAETSAPNTYAVLYYNDLSPEKGLVAVQKSLAAMTLSDLAQFKDIRVVDRVRLQALTDEIKLGTTGAVDLETAPRAGRLLGASHFVAGTLSTLLRDLRINTSLMDSRQGDEAITFLVKERIPQFFKLQKEIVYQIVTREKISLSRAEKKILKTYHTEDLDAFLYYGEGLDATDRGEWKVAKDYYTLALDLDPDFDLARQARDQSPDGLGISIDQVKAMAVDVQAVNAVGDSLETIFDKALHDQQKEDSSSSGPQSNGGSGNGGSHGGSDGGGHSY